DNQVYWAILGINPANGRWSYLDATGTPRLISTALNDAPGHLVKDGVNYANIYSTVSQAQWIPVPSLISARIFVSVGTPCYIKTFDSGFAGPNIDNPTDPNRNIYFDFAEFTLDSTGYHGNTTRVDAFSFPLQMRLIN
ncbi:beta-1,3-glucanase family protein, partial [Enterobacter hormaechei]|uniref:beta-1,3-glucanase family protein n=1 Tax=Enterobacter hormaechei TaxID=158836 RepID=UPI001A9C782E